MILRGGRDDQQCRGQLLLALEIARPGPGTEVAAVPDTDTLARLCHLALTVASVTALCNAGDWEAVTRLLAHQARPRSAPRGPPRI